MAAARNNRPTQYRAKAHQARNQAEIASDAASQRKLLEVADLWERMADYDEKNPSAPSDGPSQPD